MITFDLPTVSVDCVTDWRGFGVPFSRSTQRQLQTYQTTYRYGLDNLAESESIFGENNVDNAQAFVSLHYSPIYRGFRADPTPSRPDQIISDSGEQHEWGMIRDHGPVIDGSGNDMHVWCVTLNSRGNWEYINFAYSPLIPNTVVYFFCEELINNFYYVGEHCTFCELRGRWQAKDHLVIGTSVSSLSLDEMLRISEEFGAAWSGADSRILRSGYALSTPPIFVQPSQIIDWVNINLRPLVAFEPFPLKFQDDGLLAMHACEAFNSNHVNMIEFFRDMRDPISLIPKLRNLKNLKTLRGVKDVSDQYLTVKFGIMPTISDLQDIVASMTKRTGYFDPNGFAIKTAYHEEALQDGELTFSLEQHAKVASQTGDNLFCSLVTGVDSLGCLPNLENIWDLIPFSFAIDWFVSVGDLLERLDANLRVAYLNVKYATLSHKTSIFKSWLPTEDFPYAITMKWVCYHRWTTDRCPTPVLSLPETVTDFNHWLDSGALIIQRLFKK